MSLKLEHNKFLIVFCMKEVCQFQHKVGQGFGLCRWLYINPALWGQGNIVEESLSQNSTLYFKDKLVFYAKLKAS